MISYAADMKWRDIPNAKGARMREEEQGNEPCQRPVQLHKRAVCWEKWSLTLIYLIYWSTYGAKRGGRETETE